MVADPDVVAAPVGLWPASPGLGRVEGVNDDVALGRPPGAASLPPNTFAGTSSANGPLLDELNSTGIVGLVRRVPASAKVRSFNLDQVITKLQETAKSD